MSTSVDESNSAFPPSVTNDLSCPFVMTSGRDQLVGIGHGRSLAPGTSEGLSSRVAAFFAGERPSHAESLLVGALPFRHDRPVHLFQPRATTKSLLIAPATLPQHWTVTPEPSASEYAESVRRALARIAEGTGLRKVVLARTLVARADRMIDPLAIVERLSGDRQATAFAVPLPSTYRQSRALVGATPELLLSKSGTLVTSWPLAGSARRQPGSADRDVAQNLSRSLKDRHEHAIVVEWIADQLAPYCDDLCVPQGPEPVSTNTMWHLGTHITGRLRDADVSSVELALALHPTPAISGLPQPLAASAIQALEPFERDYFAGAVGWCNARGDGRWVVAIRCAEVNGDSARLYAGAGIVAGSDPDAETAETSAKFMTLLAALGIDEQGRTLGAPATQ